MKYEKVKLRKINDPFSLQTGDLIFHKSRLCEVTILGLDNIFSGYRVIFHDVNIMGNLPFESVLYKCRIIE